MLKIKFVPLRVSVCVSVIGSRYVFRETKDSIHAVLSMCNLRTFDTFQICGSYVFRCESYAYWTVHHLDI